MCLRCLLDPDPEYDKAMEAAFQALEQKIKKEDPEAYLWGKRSDKTVCMHCRRLSENSIDFIVYSCDYCSDFEYRLNRFYNELNLSHIPKKICKYRDVSTVIKIVNDK